MVGKTGRLLKILIPASLLVIMDDLIEQVQCRSKSDSKVMRVLRSAMDEAHETLHSEGGLLEFIHDRSTFYKLAAVLVEGGMSFVQEETDLSQSNSDKILTDLMGIKSCLQGRIKGMKQLIMDKDRELLERLDNELKLRQSLELKDRELIFLQEKLMKYEDIHDLPRDNWAMQEEAVEGNIGELKASLDQTMGYIKKNLDDEEKSSIPNRRTRKYHASSPNLSFDFLDKERNGVQSFEEHVFVKSWNSEAKSQPSTPDKNMLVRRMSSDIDSVKETLDLAFEKIQSAETLPAEKEWKWTIEKGVEKILVTGFIRELRMKVGFFEDNWYVFTDEMRTLFADLNDFLTKNNLLERDYTSCALQKAASSPLPNSVDLENFLEDETEADGSHYVAKMIKSHEYIIRKQHCDLNFHARGVREGSCSWIKREKDRNRLEKRIQDAVIKMDNLVIGNHDGADQPGVCYRNIREEKKRVPKSDDRASKKVDSLEKEIQKLRKERDVFMNIEDSYRFRIQGMVKDFLAHFSYETVTPVKQNSEGLQPNHFSYNQIKHGNELHRTFDELESTMNQLLLHCFESRMREDLYMIFFGEMVEQWNNFAVEHSLEVKNRTITFGNPITSQIFQGPSSDSVLQESIGSLLKEDIYMVFFREMINAWKSEKDAYNVESVIREDIYEFVFNEAVKDSYAHIITSEALKQPFIQDRMPRSFNLDASSFPGSTPRSRKLDMDGEDSVTQKLDSLSKCLEAEEDLMLKASCEIREHSVNNRLIILNCEENDERDAINWLLTDDESTFSSVSEKLKRALQQVYSSKELLVELGQSLEEFGDLRENGNQVHPYDHVMGTEHETTCSFLQGEDNPVRQVIQPDNILAIIARFPILLRNFEQLLLRNLERKCLRLELLKTQVDVLVEPVALLRSRKLLYKNAFISRCQNLKLAETEVDLLGDQVDSLVCILKRIYDALNKNATALSSYMEVYDILKLIQIELSNS